MAKIAKLTPEQVSGLPAFRDEWLRIGLSCKPVDRAACRAAVERLYAAGGQAKPAVMFFDSPAPCLLALAQYRSANGNLRTNLWDSLGANLRAHLRETLRANVDRNLRESLDTYLRANLAAALRANFAAGLRANLGANLGAREHTWFWGGHDAPWLAYYDYARVLGVRYRMDEHLSAYIDCAKNSGWLYAYPGLALISDRPELIVQDDRQRLHCEAGPAVRFRDGYSVYAWHGQNIPAAWIEDRASLTPGIALGQLNVELRRAACEILGWDAILTTLGAQSIDMHPDPEIGELVEVTLEGRPARFLRMTCGTGRRFACRVPFQADDPELFAIDSAWAAQAWIHGETPETFVQPYRS